MKLELVDIMGLRYRAGGTDRASGVCCLWTVHTVAARIFPDFDPAELPLRDEDIVEAVRRMGEGLARWRPIATNWTAADRLGDVIAGEEEGHGYCAIVIDAVGRIACSANEKRGVFCGPVRALRGVSAVYRRG